MVTVGFLAGKQIDEAMNIIPFLILGTNLVVRSVKGKGRACQLPLPLEKSSAQKSMLLSDH